ncbi:hypothetical protein QTP88_007255 [Uroleucon formosanum]
MAFGTLSLVNRFRTNIFDDCRIDYSVCSHIFIVNARRTRYRSLYTIVEQSLLKRTRRIMKRSYVNHCRMIKRVPMTAIGCRSTIYYTVLQDKLLLLNNEEDLRLMSKISSSIFNGILWTTMTRLENVHQAPTNSSHLT